MTLLAGLCVGAITFAAFGISAVAAAALPLSAIVLAPLALTVLVWLLHVQALVYVRWTFRLLPRANVPNAVPMPA